MDKLLHRVRGLVERGERLSATDCRALFDVHDLNEFSKLSRIVRERRYGRDAFYRSVEVFEYRGEPVDLFLSKIETSASGDAAELAIKPLWNLGDGLEKWLERFRAFASAVSGFRPIVLTMTARFTAGLAEIEGRKAGEILSGIRELLPVRLSGQGAELFDDEWRARYVPGAVSSERWLAVHQGAHELGIPSDAALTYHNGWNADLYVSHLETLRGLQDRTGGFQGFAPMAFHDTHPDARYLATPTAATTLKLTAIARLFLDNVPHINALPAMSDPEISYVALSYGADTIDPAIHPSDLESLNDEASILSGGELPVLSEENVGRGNKLALPTVEEHIVEARWRPIPVNGQYERIATVEIE